MNVPVVGIMPYAYAISLNAFNLWVGATFLSGERVYIIHEFRDFGANEKVLAVTHRGDDSDNELVEIPFLFHYMDKVSVIGNVRNPQDFDDNDWGN